MIHKALKIAVALSFTLSLLFLFNVTSFADSQVHIDTSVPKIHSITVKADNAEVYIDGKSSDVFTVERLSQPRLLFCPEANRTITKVLLNNTDITNEIIDGYYTLPPISCDIALSIETINLSHNDSTTPQTGDNNNAPLLIVLLFVSGGALIFFGMIRKCSKPE